MKICLYDGSPVLGRYTLRLNKRSKSKVVNDFGKFRRFDVRHREDDVA